jgi:ankyrin repeat protein
MATVPCLMRYLREQSIHQYGTLLKAQSQFKHAAVKWDALLEQVIQRDDLLLIMESRYPINKLTEAQIAVLMAHAVVSNDLKAVQILLGGGVNPNAMVDVEAMRTMLHEARDARVLHMLIKAGGDVHAVDYAGQAPLHRVQDGISAQVLLAAGADPNAKDVFDRTPVFYAPDARTIDALKEQGADLNARDKDGHTAHFYALKENRVQAATALLRLKAALK